MENTAKQEIKAALGMVADVAEAIRQAGEIPEGTLYAVLMGRVSFEGFQRLVGILVGSGLVENRAHLLRWVGPEAKA